MSKIILLTLIALILPCLSFSAQVGKFHYQNQDQLSFQLASDDWDRISSKVYAFVSSYIEDAHGNDPIQVIFDPGLECVGFSSRASEHLREIRISTKIRSHVDYQVILAHELTHVLRHMYQPEEAYWLDEGLAKWMEWKYIGEFPTQYVTDIHASPAIRLLDQPLDCHSSGPPDYASAYFFVLYLRNHLGGDLFISSIATSPLSGWKNIENTAKDLRSRGVISIEPNLLNEKPLLEHFAFSLLLNDPFLADYALFQLDRKYRPSEQSVLQVTASESLESRICTNYEIKPATQKRADITIHPVQSIPSASQTQQGSSRFLQICLPEAPSSVRN